MARMTTQAAPAAPSPPTRKRLPIIEGVCLAVLLAVPLFTSDFHTVIASRMLILALLAVSFDLCWGWSGIMTFGQALYFGAGGYVGALFANKAGINELLIVLPVSMLTGLVFALVVGWFLLLGKRTPAVIFVSLGTLTASYAAERLVAGWPLVGAGNGMSVSALPTLAGFKLSTGPLFYYVILALVLAAYLTSRFIVRSQFGLVLAGMRQNEERLAYFGYRVPAFKAMIFAFAGALAGLGGGLFVFHEGFIGPSNLGIGLSTYAVLYGLFGGLGTLIGPILGVFAIETLAFVLSDIDAIRSYWPIILGLIMLIVVVWRPTGLMGFILSEREKVGSYGKGGGDGTP
jgi:branched-chain amino acid transport system permease protein